MYGTVTQLCVLTSLLATAIARPLAAQTPPPDQHVHTTQPSGGSPCGPFYRR